MDNKPEPYLMDLNHYKWRNYMQLKRRGRRCIIL